MRRYPPWMMALSAVVVMASGAFACSNETTAEEGDIGGGVPRDGGTHDAKTRDATGTPEEPDADQAIPELDGGESNLRVVAANLSSGNKQYYLEPGIHILKGLKADIGLLQEFNYGTTNSDADVRAFVDEAFGKSYSYFREAGATVPNGIVSRYPIVESGEWEDTQSSGTRDFVWARIDVPGTVDLWAISVHLKSGNASSVRASETTEIVKKIGEKIPKSDYVVLGGDFNTEGRSENCITNLSSTFTTSGPYPVDQAGAGETNANRNKPYDWVLANPLLQGRRVPVKVGASTLRDGLVVDTRVYKPIADLSPATAEDSAASGMQHMAVVRDFRVE